MDTDPKTVGLTPRKETEHIMRNNTKLKEIKNDLKLKKKPESRIKQKYH